MKQFPAKSYRQLKANMSSGGEEHRPTHAHDSRGHEQESYQCYTCTNMNCSTGNTPKPEKENELLAINTLGSKKDFQQHVNLIVSKTIVALRWSNTRGVNVMRECL